MSKIDKQINKEIERLIKRYDIEEFKPVGGSRAMDRGIESKNPQIGSKKKGGKFEVSAYDPSEGNPMPISSMIVDKSNVSITKLFLIKDFLKLK